MRPEPVLTAGARSDLGAAAGQYEARRDGLGSEFLDEFDGVVSLVRETPLLSTLVDPPVRRSLMRRFPYGVFFVPGSADVPDVILAVVDLRQDPEVVRRAYRR